MTSQEKMVQLALMRLQQSEESLQEADLLLRQRMSLRGVVNRAYYAMFYAVLALLIFEPYSTSKHKGVLSYFHKRFIHEGILSRELGEYFQEAFDLRIRSDYQENFPLTLDRVEPLLARARIFIDEIKGYLHKSHEVQNG